MITIKFKLNVLGEHSGTRETESSEPHQMALLLKTVHSLLQVLDKDVNVLLAGVPPNAQPECICSHLLWHSTGHQHGRGLTATVGVAGCTNAGQTVLQPTHHLKTCTGDSKW